MQGDGSSARDGPANEQSLVAHRGFVEALARRLVFDRSVADDIVQETLLSALRNPPREPSAMRSWLARVVRNLAYRTLRTRERRRRREHRAARPEATPPTDDVVARLAWHRTVVDAVLALPDDMRETLILRYYEELTPKEIAERQGVPAATVRSRLKRGLAAMRRRLSDKHGSERAWMLGLIPLLVPSRPAAAATGGAALGVATMGVQNKLTVAALVLMALAGTFLVGRYALRNDEGTTHRSAGRLAAASSDADAPDAIERATPVSAVAFDVLVVDTYDSPIEGATVDVSRGAAWSFVGPWVGNETWIHNWLLRSEERRFLGSFTTDAQGRARIHGVPCDGVDVRASHRDYASVNQWVWYQPPEMLRLHLGRGVPLRGRVINGNGRPIPGALVFAGDVRRQGNFGTDALPERVVADAEGRYRFPSLPRTDRMIWAAFPGGAAIFIATLRYPGLDDFDIHLHHGGVLRGQVTDDETGAPVAGVSVIVRAARTPIRFHARAVTDASGKYAIDTLPLGRVGGVSLEKSGWAQAYKKMTTAIELRAGETATLDGEMYRAASVRGVVTGPGGPVAGAGVSSWYQTPVGTLVVRQAVTDESGRFLLSDLPAGKHVLGVRKLGYADALRLLDHLWKLSQLSDHPNVVALGRGTQAQHDLKVTRNETVVAEGVVVGPDGKGFEGADVTAPGGARATTDADGAFRLDGVLRQGPMNALISVRAKGFQVTGEQPSVPPDTDHVRDLRIVLAPKPEPVVVGIVRDATGTLPPGVTIRLATLPRLDIAGPMCFQARHLAWQHAARVSADRDGRFEVAMPDADRFAILASAPDRARGTPIMIRREQDRLRYDVELVLDPGHSLSGTTVPGARVLLQSKTSSRQKYDAVMSGISDVPVAAVADAQGAFRIDHLAAGRWEVAVELDGHAPAREVVTLPQARELRIVPAPVVSVGGVVLFEDGSPVVGARITVSRLDAQGVTEMTQGVQYANRTDARGRWRKDGLRPGRYRMNLQGDAAANFVRQTDDTVRGGQTELRFVVRRGLAVRGRVLDVGGGGVPLVNVVARKRDATKLRFFDQVQTAEDGSFTLVGLPPGELDFTLTRFEKSFVLRGVSAGTTDLRIMFDPTRDDLGREDVREFSGTIADEQGRPMVGRTVHVARPDTSLLTRSKKTDASGRFSFTVGPGRYRLWMLRRSGPAQHVPDLGLFEAGPGLKIRARRGESIQGTVVGADGKPAAGVRVRATMSRKNRVTARTDANGRFELGGLAPEERCEVVTVVSDWVPDLHRGVKAGTRGLKLVLRPGLGARGLVRDRNDEAVAKTEMRLVLLSDTTRHWRGRTDAAGAFHVRGLLPGRYRVELLNANRRFQSCGELDAGATGVTVRFE